MNIAVTNNIDAATDILAKRSRIKQHILVAMSRVPSHDGVQTPRVIASTGSDFYCAKSHFTLNAGFFFI